MAVRDVLDHPGRSFDAWYHLFQPGASEPFIGRPATLAELTRVLKSGRYSLDDNSYGKTLLTHRHLDGRREVYTITEAFED